MDVEISFEDINFKGLDLNKRLVIKWTLNGQVCSVQTIYNPYEYSLPCYV